MRRRRRTKRGRKLNRQKKKCACFFSLYFIIRAAPFSGLLVSDMRGCCEACRCWWLRCDITVCHQVTVLYRTQSNKMWVVALFSGWFGKNKADRHEPPSGPTWHDAHLLHGQAVTVASWTGDSHSNCVQILLKLNSAKVSCWTDVCQSSRTRSVFVLGQIIKPTSGETRGIFRSSPAAGAVIGQSSANSCCSRSSRCCCSAGSTQLNY